MSATTDVIFSLTCQPDLEAYPTFDAFAVERTERILEVVQQLRANGAASISKPPVKVIVDQNVLDRDDLAEKAREFLGTYSSARWPGGGGPVLQVDLAEPMFTYYYASDVEWWKREGFFLTMNDRDWEEIVEVDGRELACRFLMTIETLLEGE